MDRSQNQSVGDIQSFNFHFMGLSSKIRGHSDRSSLVWGLKKFNGRNFGVAKAFATVD